MFSLVVSVQSSTKVIHILHDTEFPFSSFAVLDSGTCLVADTGFDSLMARMKAFYIPRKASKIEVNFVAFLYWITLRTCHNSSLIIVVLLT